MRNQRHCGGLLTALFIWGTFAAAADSPARSPLQEIDASLISTGKDISKWKECLAKRNGQVSELRQQYEVQMQILQKDAKPKLAALPAKAAVDTAKIAGPVVDMSDDPKEVAECKRTFDIKKVIGSPLLPAWLLGEYYSCKSIATGSTAPCRELSPYRKTEDISSERRCNEVFHRSMFAKSLFSGTPTQTWQHCQAMVGFSNGGYKIAPEKAKTMGKSFCEALIAGDVPAACALMKANGVALPNCEAVTRHCIWGDGKELTDVAQMVHMTSGEQCNSFVAFKRARTAGKADACGNNGVCRALMGQPESACDTYLVPLANYYCKTPSAHDPNIGKVPPVGEADRRQQLEDAKASAAAAKEGIEKTLKSPPALKGDSIPVAQKIFSTKMQTLESACDPFQKDIRARLDETFSKISGIQPPTADLDARRERYAQLQDRYNAVYKTSVGKQGKSAPAKAAE